MKQKMINVLMNMSDSAIARLVAEERVAANIILNAITGEIPANYDDLQVLDALMFIKNTEIDEIMSDMF